MRFFLRFLLLASLSPICFLPSAQAAGPTYAALVDQLNPQKNTKLQLKETWNKYKGQEVSWSGTVVEVKEGRHNSAKIYVADKSRKLYKNYNITIAVKGTEKAAKLKRGQLVRFKGALYSFDHRDDGRITIINLKNGEVL
ncbi:MAG TPA: hypothetical protein DIC36_00840 [Gammaproteobacteria bacterium]|nr:hypothetical protein [Gammaproteobacteria bacterium]